jgi:hypothetical protein
MDSNRYGEWAARRAVCNGGQSWIASLGFGAQASTAIEGLQRGIGSRPPQRGRRGPRSMRGRCPK